MLLLQKHKHWAVKQIFWSHVLAAGSIMLLGVISGI